MHLEMKNIVMDFGPVRAVNDVSITLTPADHSWHLDPGAAAPECFDAAVKRKRFEKAFQGPVSAEILETLRAEMFPAGT